MPRNGITGQGRRPRRWIVRCGYKKAGRSEGGYPFDGDQFYVCARDGWTADDVAPFGARVISDALKDEAGPTWGIGRSLRLVFPRHEFDAVIHDKDGRSREPGLEIRNEAYSASGLQCWGTGSDAEHGVAWIRNERWVPVIGKYSNHTPVEVRPGKEWRGVCMGEACPFSPSHPKATKASSCKPHMRLHAMLLHPAEDPADPNYLHQLGWCWIVTGSLTAMGEVQGGLQDLREDIGRTEGIPFWLRRVRHRLSYDDDGQTKSVYKYTLQVTHDDDVGLFVLEGHLVRFRPAVQKRALAQMSDQQRFRAARDLVMRVDGGLPPPDAPLPEARGLPSARPISGDRDDDLAAPVDASYIEAPVDAASARAPEVDETSLRENLGRELGSDETGELKRLLGATPGMVMADDSEPIRLLALCYVELDGREPGERPMWGDARLRHLLWARDRAARGVEHEERVTIREAAQTAHEQAADGQLAHPSYPRNRRTPVGAGTTQGGLFGDEAP